MTAYTDADVQAAALAAFSFEQCDRRQKLNVEGNWESRLNERDQQEYRNLARASLDAVAPSIAARALREFATNRVVHQTPARLIEDMFARADEIERNSP